MAEFRIPAATALPEAGNPVLRGRTTSVSTYCRICEAACGLIAEKEGDRLVRVRPNPAHAHSRGFSCSKPQGLIEITYDPDRITRPMIRTGGPGEFAPTTWDEALALCAKRLSGVRDEFGPESIANLRGNPPYFESAGVLWSAGFSTALGITRTYGINAEDGASRLTANEALYGDVNRFPRPDLWHSGLALIIGANPLVARSTRVSEPQSREAFDSIIARGGRVLVVDPQRTATAERYEHISIRPGTDPWFLMGVCKVICEDPRAEELALRGARLSGLEQFAQLAAEFDLLECAANCGTTEAVLRDVGCAFVEAESAVVYGGTGTCAQRFGTLTNILQDTVAALTGNVDRVGGFLAGWGAIDLTPSTLGPKSGARRSRVEGRPEVAGSLPSAALPADILEPGDDRVRALVIRGNNSVLSSGGGGERFASALQQLDFSLAMDLYMNETNRYADVLLPVTAMYERDDYPITTATLQLRPTAYATRAVIPPQGEARDSWWVFDEISRRMGLGGSCPDKALESAAEARGERPSPVELIDRLLEAGPINGLTFDDLVTRHPNGIRLSNGLAVGRLTADLPTADGGVQVNSVELRSEVARLRAYIEPDENWPLRMVGRREKGSQNTWMHNSRVVYADDYVFAAHVHPADAEANGVKDGDEVRLVSAAGEITLRIAVRTSVRPGVVSVPNGWGHTADGGSWTRANAISSANSNELVSHDDFEAVAGMSILNGVPIRLERLEEAVRNDDK